jgi:hypothetical protein
MKGKRSWSVEPTGLTETRGERESREWIEAQKEIADLKHRLDQAERTARVAANLLLKKKIT